MELIAGIDHRMNLLEQSHATLNSNIKDITDDTAALDTKITAELASLKNETAAILRECDHVRKTVFKMGSLLRSMASKQELADFEEKVKDWPVHEFITKKELESTFNKYAKQ